MNWLLDTNTVLYLLGGRLASPLPIGDYFVSIITEIELFSYHSLDVKAETDIQLFLSKMVLVELTPAVKHTTIHLRRRHHLKVPDAIIAASALTLQAGLLTNDIKLSEIPELLCHRIHLK